MTCRTRRPRANLSPGADKPVVDLLVSTRDRPSHGADRRCSPALSAIQLVFLGFRHNSSKDFRYLPTAGSAPSTRPRAYPIPSRALSNRSADLGPFTDPISTPHVRCGLRAAMEVCRRGHQTTANDLLPGGRCTPPPSRRRAARPPRHRPVRRDRGPGQT